MILRDGKEFTIIDSGYRADTELVLGSIRCLGLNPSNAAAVLITHGHVDHTGAAEMFSSSFGTPVLSSVPEHGQLIGSEKFQVAPIQIIARAWHPKVFKWMVHVAQSGGTKGIPVPGARTFETYNLQELPGHPVAVPTPGHSPGHTAFFIPKSHAVLTGDALVAGHGVTRRTGPQLIHPMFDHDTAMARSSLPELTKLDAHHVLPGHGKAMHMNIKDAVVAALSR